MAAVNSQVRADVQTISSTADKQGETGSEPVVYGATGAVERTMREIESSRAYPAKKAKKAKVEYSAALAFALVAESTCPPAPNPFTALKRPMGATRKLLCSSKELRRLRTGTHKAHESK